MDFLVRSIQRTADIAGGYTVGNLVIEPQGVFIQKENGELVPVTGKLEVKIGDSWEFLTVADYNEETIYGNLLNAGLDARMM